MAASTNLTDPAASDAGEAVPRRFWWLKRVGVGVVILVVLLGGLRWWWGAHAHAKLRAEIDRIRAAGEPIDIDDFQPRFIAAERNAAPLLRRAEAQLGTDGGTFLELTRDPATIRANDAAIRSIIAGNANALALAREARDRPDAEWNVRITRPVFTFMLPSVAGQRSLAKAICASARYRHHVGDDAEAVELLLDVLGASAAVDKMPGLIPHLVAIAEAALGARAIEEIAPSLMISDAPPAVDAPTRPATRERLDAIIGAMLDNKSLQDSLILSVSFERMLQYDMVQQITGRTGSSAMTGFAVPGTPSLANRIEIALFAPAFALDSVRSLRHMSAVVQAAREPNWPAASGLFPPEPAPITGLDRLTFPLSQILLPSLGRGIVLHFRALAEIRMAATALAIRAYELDHGRRPADLIALVPEYLPEVPEDPFAPAGRKIGYHPDADSPILYSIGEDGIDDNGDYGLRPSGYVNYDTKDLPFFLNGDRPRGKRQPSPTVPPVPSTQAGQGYRDVEDDERDPEKDESGKDQP